MGPLKLFRRKPAAPNHPIDPAMGDRQARLLIDALSARDWPTARGVLVAAEHPDDRAFLLDACGEASGVQDWIASPAVDDPLALLVRGCHATAWAWQARGAYSVRYTQAEQFKVFFERLRVAESCLYDVTNRIPEEPAAWAFLVRTARGLQLPLEDGEFRYQQAIERHPGHLKAHAEWLQTQCKKWSGSHEQMLAFARDTSARAVGGSMLPALLALAHLEVMIDLDSMTAAKYITRPDVVADLRAAADKSIWHPDAEFRPGWPLYFNIFAVAFSQSGDPAAAVVFERLGDNLTTFPWGYLGGDEATAFLKARTAALAAR